MSISVDSNYNYLNATSDAATSSANASSVSSKLGNVNSSSSESDMKDAIKDFESYFVEQMLKNVEDSLKSDDEDSTNSQMTDYYMDSVNQKMSDELLDQCGDRVTQKLYEQMKRNYNMTDSNS